MPNEDFRNQDLVAQWELLLSDAQQLVEFALREDLGDGYDVTTDALVPVGRPGAANFVAREAGVACGVAIGPLVRDAFGASFEWSPAVSDGDRIAAGDRLATISGSASQLLTCERTLLNFMGRLSGVATLARRYADKVQDTPARVYDTRKTTPGWRQLEKYAVACGGANNHRMGLHDAVLIKDNHLAFASEQDMPISDAIHQARAAAGENVLVQVEVDTLDQLQQVLAAKPDMVLLDNMTNDQLRQAVELRDAQAAMVQLEASGGVTLDTIGAIGRTGVERISVGALTHSARSLDIGLDWRA